MQIVTSSTSTKEYSWLLYNKHQKVEDVEVKAEDVNFQELEF